MTLLILLFILGTSVPVSVTENVHTVRVGTTPGGIELCTAVSISPCHAVAMCLFSPNDSISVETSQGIAFPDSMTFSPDLGLVVMRFDQDVFLTYQEPSSAVPSPGDQVIIVGQGLSGMIDVRGRTIEQYPDGSMLISAELRDGLMGAAVFSEDGDFLGMISGMVRPSRQFPEDSGRDYLVLYPGQIWYMWARLVILERDFSEYSFGVTAMSSISLSASRPSGIQIVSVSSGSLAWDCGLRPGDLITHIDQVPVYHPETLRGLLVLSQDTLEARVERNNYIRQLRIPPFD